MWAVFQDVTWILQDSEKFFSVTQEGYPAVRKHSFPQCPSTWSLCRIPALCPWVEGKSRIANPCWLLLDHGSCFRVDQSLYVTEPLQTFSNLPYSEQTEQVSYAFYYARRICRHLLELIREGLSGAQQQQGKMHDCVRASTLPAAGIYQKSTKKEENCPV